MTQASQKLIALHYATARESHGIAKSVRIVARETGLTFLEAGRLVGLTDEWLQANAPKPRGGPGMGQGRKPMDPAARAVSGSIRLTAAQWEQFHAIGGLSWLRAQLLALGRKGKG